MTAPCQIWDIGQYIYVIVPLSLLACVSWAPLSLRWLSGGGGCRAHGHIWRGLIPTLGSLCFRVLTRLQVIICKSSPASALLDFFPDEISSNKSWITKILCFVSGAKKKKKKIMHIERQVSAKGKELDWWGSAFITSGGKMFLWKKPIATFRMK